MYLDCFLKVLMLALYNSDLFLTNFAVFCFGYYIFTNRENRKEELKISTTDKIGFKSTCYFQGESPFNEITPKDVKENPNKTIMFFCTPEHIEISKTEYFQLYNAENFNEKYERAIVNLEREILIGRVGAGAVILSMIISIYKSINEFWLTVAVSCLYILLGITLLKLILYAAEKLYKYKAVPQKPKFKNFQQ